MLFIGVFPIMLLLIMVGTDAAVLFTHRRALAAEADAAAIAGAQSADLEGLYTGGEPTSLPLDCAKARHVVAARIGSSSSDSRVTRAALGEVRCDGTSVSVILRSQAVLPFASELGVKPQVSVRADASARSPLR